jgi:hypothetical protein
MYSIFILYFFDDYPFLFIFVYFHIASDPLTSKQSKKTLSKQKTILLKDFYSPLIFLFDCAILQTQFLNLSCTLHLHANFFLYFLVSL